ncbi:DUF2919 family protein [Thiocapsa imhoffii]|uniref:DUF2919 family protein n=1 Tax=Thiocapsa imhoffii TaxID=382777 RepID=UPI001905AD34
MYDAADRYDEDLLLKVPIPLWLVILFLVRHLLLLGITFMPTMGEGLAIIRNLVMPAYLLADLPAVLVLLAAMRRARPCKDWVRWIWWRAREILSLSILLYLALVGRAVWQEHSFLWQSIDEAMLVSLMLSLAALVYLWRSSLLAAVVRDCPGQRD